MKISASIYSNKQKKLEQLVRELDAHKIDMLHVDCLDNPKVFEDIKRIRQVSKTPIDLHIIAPDPERYLPLVEEMEIEYCSFQYENLQALPQLPASGATRYGLAVLASTPPASYESTVAGYHFMVMMCTVPGQSGRLFNKQNFQHIIELKQRYPSMQIHVDGGVTDRIAYILRLLGVTAVVSGSYLLNHESLGAGMLSLHTAPGAATDDYAIGDFALPAGYLPVMPVSELTFKGALQAIEKYKQGFLLVTDSQGGLKGVVSNADIRRGMLKYLEAGGVSTADFVNTNPVTINEKAGLTHMVQLLNNLSFIVLFLPVTDAENRLKGAVLLNQLTRV